MVVKLLLYVNEKKNESFVSIIAVVNKSSEGFQSNRFERILNFGFDL